MSRPFCQDMVGLAKGSAGLFVRVTACFDDARQLALVVHEVRALVGQRILGLPISLENLNDHEEFRKDPVAGALLGCPESKREDCEPLAGKSTLNRLELAVAGMDGKKIRKIVADFVKMDDLLAEPLHQDNSRSKCRRQRRTGCREPAGANRQPPASLWEETLFSSRLLLATARKCS